MVWIAGGYGFVAVANTFEMEALADKKTMVLTIAYGLAATTKIVATVVLLPKVGILGAAQATCLAFAVYMTVLAVLATRRRKKRIAT
ncbi:MAG: polysaccharide biosynthesis C-terminal domain-containing protein [Pseudomonadota bacterium]